LLGSHGAGLGAATKDTFWNPSNVGESDDESTR
jgi:hypothetical protein